MNTNYLEKLEFNKILETLSNYCFTYIGKEKALGLVPITAREVVKSMLAETEEAINLSYRNSSPSFLNFSYIIVDFLILEIIWTLYVKSLLYL